jgi:cytochrome c-type biogenesis protein CcmE
MSGRNLKFGIGIALIIGIVVWEAIAGFRQSKTYYVTVNELVSGKMIRKHVRVGGKVSPGSIERHGEQLSFRLAQGNDILPVVYVGTETLPDTFKGGAQAIVQGTYMPDGVFRATEIQAKCASKYVAVPTAAPAAKTASMSGS